MLGDVSKGLMCELRLFSSWRRLLFDYNYIIIILLYTTEQVSYDRLSFIHQMSLINSNL